MRDPMGMAWGIPGSGQRAPTRPSRALTIIVLLFDMMKLVLLLVALVAVFAVRDLARLDSYSFEEFVREHRLDIPSHEKEMRRGLFAQVRISRIRPPLSFEMAIIDVPTNTAYSIIFISLFISFSFSLTLLISFSFSLSLISHRN